MSNFNIDFFELGFLAEVCVPPTPIARSMFWQNLTDKYWQQMTEEERGHLFEWLNRNEKYKRSLEEEEETKIFHARFNPDNQYSVLIHHESNQSEYRAFKYGERFFVHRNTWIDESSIVEVKKLNYDKR
jgi:hypothetical protein